MSLNLDPLLLDLEDFNIIRDISPKTEPSRLDAYIREAQVNEIRSFLGDELYVLLVNNYIDLNPKSVFEFEADDENFAASAGTPVYQQGTGWIFSSPGDTIALADYDDAEGPEDFIFEWDAATFVNTTAIIKHGATSVNVPVNVPGQNSGNLTFESSPASLSFEVQNPSVPFTLKSWVIGGTRLPDRFNDLYDGTDYIRQGSDVRFNGLRMAHLYWSYARFLNNQALNVTRYGVKSLEDENSINVAQAQIRNKANEAKSMALLYQEDAFLFLDENRATYPEWERPFDRRATKKSFKFSRI